MMEREWIITDGDFKGEIVWLINFQNTGKNVMGYCVDPINGTLYQINWSNLSLCTEANREAVKEILEWKRKKRDK